MLKLLLRKRAKVRMRMVKMTMQQMEEKRTRALVLSHKKEMSVIQQLTLMRRRTQARLLKGMRILQKMVLKRTVMKPRLLSKEKWIFLRPTLMLIR